MILGLAAVFLGSPPLWVKGAGAGAGAAVAAVALKAGSSLLPGSRKRAGSALRSGWALYLLAGALAAATLGPWLVLVLLGCGAPGAPPREGEQWASRRCKPPPRPAAPQRRSPQEARSRSSGSR